MDWIPSAKTIAPIPLFPLALLVLLFAPPAAGFQEVRVPFNSDQWVIAGGELTTRWGRECLAGSAYLKEVAFQDGVIDVDLAVSGERSYPGILFRLRPGGNMERIYLRPHRAGLYADAIQYTPVFNGVDSWQLWNGEGYTSGAIFPANQWMHLRIEVNGTQARLFIDDMEHPAFRIHGLKHGVSSGTLGLASPTDSTACFANFRYRLTDDLAFEAPPAVATPDGTLTHWEVSRVYPAEQVNRDSYPGFLVGYQAEWQSVPVDASGIVDVSRVAGRSVVTPELVFARTLARSDRRQEVKLTFGYSDEIDLFVNKRKVFSGDSRYQHRDSSFLGVVGPYDAVYVTLEKGLNEIFLMLTETRGGWGFLARADPALDEAVRSGGEARPVWETGAELLTPESVYYDPRRGVLYVTNYDMPSFNSADSTGFISRVGMDGRMLDLRWVTGLKLPAGMVISGNRLYTLERQSLAEIDIESGRILRRYPIPEPGFPNDVAVDGEGNLYISDTGSGPSRPSRILRLKDGRIEPWLDSNEISRANAIWVHGDRLLVGNSGDGLFKAVDLHTRKIETITSLGWGVIDGIRVDRDGSYLVSLWEGQVYRITPDGEVTEILDLYPQRLNTADFEYLPDTRTFYFPTFLANKVAAYRMVGHE
jgi:sugar lactone lactonase YvrE